MNAFLRALLRTRRAGALAPIHGAGGFALLGALWLIVVIAGVSLSITVESRGRRSASRNVTEALLADAALDAAVIELRRELTRALNDPLAPEAAADPWGDLLPYSDSGRVGHARYVAAASDLEARLNVNLATDQELQRFLQALGIGDRPSRIIAESILDWRDADDLHRANGAERDWYGSRDPLHPGPSNRPLRSVAELRRIRGVTPEVFDRLAPLLTVHSDGRVNWNTAPAPVLLALPGMSPLAVATILNRRAGGRTFQGAYELALELPHRERDMLEEAMPALMLRSSFEVRRLLVELDGWAFDQGLQRSRRMILSREGGAVYAQAIQSGG